MGENYLYKNTNTHQNNRHHLNNALCAQISGGNMSWGTDPDISGIQELHGLTGITVWIAIHIHSFNGILLLMHALN